MSDNPSFVLHGINNVAYEQRPIPEISDDEVLVEVKKTGICGSDVHYLVAGRIGQFIVEDPMVLGHESAGIVSKVGPKVKHLKPGDRVAMEPGATCRVCEDCKRGRYELCPDIVFAATPPYDGTLARYYPIPADLCYKLPDHLTLEDGAMMEPLSVAIHAVAIDLVVEASGAEVSIQTGIFIARTGGTFVQLGMGAPQVVIPITTLLTKELNFKGSFRYGPGDYELAIALVEQGKIDLKPLITHRFTFDQAIEAFETTKVGKSPDGKPVIKAVISGPDVPVDVI
ncbi:unnamed protein product [Somion occarium]|uniref:Enoyl reductase (ER) domain-containing protein n=1 Tax=Somion occarium TaxID=3059160 RepID=A0ABP1D269_9APHY